MWRLVRGGANSKRSFLASRFAVFVWPAAVQAAGRAEGKPLRSDARLAQWPRAPLRRLVAGVWFTARARVRAQPRARTTPGMQTYTGHTTRGPPQVPLSGTEKLRSEADWLAALNVHALSALARHHAVRAPSALPSGCATHALATVPCGSLVCVRACVRLCAYVRARPCVCARERARVGECVCVCVARGAIPAVQRGNDSILFIPRAWRLGTCALGAERALACAGYWLMFHV